LARVVNLKNQVEEKQIMGKIRARRIKLDTPEKILKKDLDPESIPCAVSVGIVFVA